MVSGYEHTGWLARWFILGSGSFVRLANPFPPLSYVSTRDLEA